ncbi:MAG: DUF4115 domain-containing protein [Arenicellales bacterium]|nr:DUF4115 domain-containing protein [Arenicellales bacterium]
MSEDIKSDPVLESPSSPGDALRQARQRFGLSEEDVAVELNLSVSQIRALEDNRFEDLPGKTYVQGYLKSYARLLNSDEDDILQNFQQEDAIISGIRPVMRETRSSDRHMKLLSVGVILVLGGLSFMWWQGREQSTVVPLAVTEDLGQQSEEQTGDLMAIQPTGLETAELREFVSVDEDMKGQQTSALEEFPTTYVPPGEANSGTIPTQSEPQAEVELGTESIAAQPLLETESASQTETDEQGNVDTSEADTTTGAQPQNTEQAPPDDEITPQTSPGEVQDVENQNREIEVAAVDEAESPETPVPRDSDQPTVATVAGIEPGHEVKLKFSATSWVDLRDANGQRLLYENVNKGREISVQGRPPFSIFLGNADGVEIDYGGKPFDFSAFTNGIYARFELGVEQLNQP